MQLSSRELMPLSLNQALNLGKTGLRTSITLDGDGSSPNPLLQKA